MRASFQCIGVAVLAACLAACGQEPSATIVDDPSAQASSLLFGEPDPRMPCIIVKLRLRNDFLAMQKVQAYKDLATTEEYKALAQTVRTFNDQQCPLPTFGNPCDLLIEEAKVQFTALRQTPQWGPLSQTNAFKAVERDVHDGARQGCFKIPISEN